MSKMEWQPIETAPRDGTIIHVAWPHRGMDGGWMFDYWSGEYLSKMEDAISKGFSENAPHLYWLPTHWSPLPDAPNG